MHGRMLQPKIARKNKDGSVQRDKFTGRVFTEYATPDEATKRVVIEYATKQDVLSVSDRESMVIINEAKQLVKGERKFLVVYHAGTDPCSTCPHNHYHIVLTSSGAIAQNTVYRKLRNLCQSKTEEAFCSEDPVGMYVKSQKVRHLPGLVAYLMVPPRVWYGTNCSEIFKLRKAILESPKARPTTSDPYVESADITEILGELPTAKGAKGSDDGWGEIITADQDITDEYDFETIAGPTPKKRKANDFEDEGPYFDESTNMVPLKSVKPVSNVVSLPEHAHNNHIGRLTDVLAYIMGKLHCDDTNMLSVKAKALEGIDPSAANYLARIKNVNLHHKRSAIISQAKEQYRMTMINKTLADLMTDTARDAAFYDDKTYICIYDAINLFGDWMCLNGWVVDDFANDIFSVLDRRGGKMNCMFIRGEPNAGKSMMFMRPIEEICQTVGRINQINCAGSTFIFESCMQCRLIAIDECCIPKSLMEECKQIFEGAACKVQIKYQRDGGLLQPTPVIASSNKEPWLYDIQNQVPLLARMRYYVAKPFDTLADFSHLKYNPLVYVLLHHYWSNKLDYEGLFTLDNRGVDDLLRQLRGDMSEYFDLEMRDI